MDVVIGAGMGGLCAAIALRRKGRSVRVYEARPTPGGLASSFTIDGRVHDGGPYILLDRPGLTCAFEQLGLNLEDHVDLLPLDEVFRVSRPDGPTLSMWRDLGRTADGIDALYPGAGARYRAFVHRVSAIYDNLTPLQRAPHAGARGLLRRGLFREGLFLARGLGAHLTNSHLPTPVQDVLGIWTHVAGQPLEHAPAPLAFVPAIVHNIGAYTVRGGIGRIPQALHRVAEDLGVDFRFGTRVDRVVRDGRRVLGVEVAGDRIPAERVFSDAPGIGTLVDLVQPPDPALSASLVKLPLQSPGVAAYLTADVAPSVPFLHFLLKRGEKVRLVVHAGAVDPDRTGTLRVLSPTDHEWAGRVGPSGQRAYLDRVLAEPWWRAGVTSERVVATRIPDEWGRAFSLYNQSMNPTMTASFMRQGRLPHVSPLADNLFLCGSATHPGQWVSFCAISGILAANA